MASWVAGLKGTANVLVTGNHELRLLNHRFRRKDKATDVLAFPTEGDSTRRCAGEIAISSEIASENARLLGHNLAQEIKILALHGILHLAGYDHERDQGEMARKELRSRTKLNLPTGLIERSRQAGADLKRTRKQARLGKSDHTSARQTR